MSARGGGRHRGERPRRRETKKRRHVKHVKHQASRQASSGK